MVKARMDSLEAAFEEENRNQPLSHKQKRYLSAKYIGTGLRQGIIGKAYPRGEDQYWFQPDTGAMGIRVGTKDLRLSEPETEHNMSGDPQRQCTDTERQDS